MGLVIKKLTHPKSLTHKDFSVYGFLREREGKREFLFSKVVFP